MIPAHLGGLSRAGGLRQLGAAIGSSSTPVVASGSNGWVGPLLDEAVSVLGIPMARLGFFADDYLLDYGWGGASFSTTVQGGIIQGGAMTSLKIKGGPLGSWYIYARGYIGSNSIASGRVSGAGLIRGNRFSGVCMGQAPDTSAYVPGTGSNTNFGMWVVGYDAGPVTVQEILLGALDTNVHDFRGYQTASTIGFAMDGTSYSTLANANPQSALMHSPAVYSENGGSPNFDRYLVAFDRYTP